jgi:polyisoprenyl-phosphate glycosyltransferase
MMKTLAVIVPCYCNSESLEELVKRIGAVRATIESKYRDTLQLTLALVDDASTDQSPTLIRQLHLQHPDWIHGILLAQNVGSHAACIVGIKLIFAQAYVIISADLQDPPEIILQLVEGWLAGHSLVLAARQQCQDQKTDRLAAQIFHRWMRFALGSHLPRKGFDCLLVDSQLTTAIKQGQMGQHHLFYELVQRYPRFITIFYIRQKRPYGHSKWTWNKKYILALRSIWRFSYGYVLEQRIRSLIRNKSQSGQKDNNTHNIRRIWWTQ